MRYRVAVEDIETNHHVAWVLDLIGCYGVAPDREGAIACLPTRIADYFAWISRHDPTMPRADAPFEVEVVEVFEAHLSSESSDYLVNAFFDDDRRVLSYWDAVTALKLMEWTRRDLLSVLGSVPPEELRAPVNRGDQPLIGAIVEHVAQAENWYFNQFDLGVEWSTLPEDAVGKLESVRANTRGQLLKLVGEERVVDCFGEKWSARKVLRRTLWHERDHTQHIAGLAAIA